MYVREFRVRYRNRRLPRDYPVGPLTTSKEVASLLTKIIGREIVEVCAVISLSTKNELIAYHELSRGTLDATIVHPRDVFRTALLTNAACVIVGHNHPSGVIQPSPDDQRLTQRLIAAGEVMGIPLTDHIIVNASGQFFSFREAALL